MSRSPSAADLDTHSYAAFGQIEYPLNSRLKLIVGARYSADRKVDHFYHQTNGSTDLVFTPDTYPGLATRDFHTYSGKVGLDFKPNDDSLWFVSANRGTKSGGFGVPSFGTLDQAFTNVNFPQFITNHPAAITGLELMLTARPIAPLTITLFSSHLFTARVNDLTWPNGQVVDTSLPQAPKLSMGGSISYDLRTRIGSIRLTSDWKYDSSQYFSAFNAPVDYEHPRAYGSVRLSYQPLDARWEAVFFVNNVANRRYRVFDFDNSAFLGVADSVYAPPRWFGGTVTVHFQGQRRSSQAPPAPDGSCAHLHSPVKRLCMIGRSTSTSASSSLP